MVEIHDMAIEVNGAARAFANSLIRSGKINKDGAWSFSAEDGNSLLDSNGEIGADYQKHFLAKDTGEDATTKAAWKFPIAKDSTIYRRGVIAAKSRAAQQGYTAIEAAADALLTAIDKKLGISEDGGSKEMQTWDIYYRDLNMSPQSTNDRNRTIELTA